MAIFEPRFDSIALYEAPLEATGSLYRLAVIDVAGASIVFSGSGFTYDVDGRPTGGTISSISLVVDDDGSDVVLATLTGINVSLDDVGDYIRDVFALRDQITWRDFVGEPITFTETYIRVANEDGTFTDVIGSGFDETVPGDAQGTVTAIRLIASDGTTVLTDLSVNVSLQAVISAVNEEAAGNGLYLLFNAGSNTFTGVSTAVVIDGDSYSTHIMAGPGADTINAGPIGAIDYEYATSGITVDLNTNTFTTAWGNDTVTGNVDFVAGTMFDDTMTGDGDANTLNGRSGNNVLSGGGGNDTLEAREGNDTLDGGADNDTAVYDFDEITTGVTVSLAVVGAQNTVGAGTDTLSSIENLVGSMLGDILIGNGAANALTGGGGNDTLIGAGGVDYLDGGDGDDVIVGFGAPSGSTFDGGANNDTLVATLGGTYDDPESPLNGFRIADFQAGTLLSIEALSFVVSSPVDQIAIISAAQLGGGQLASNLSIVTSSQSNVVHVNATGGALDLSTWTFDGGWNAIVGGEFDVDKDVVWVAGSISADTVTGTSKGDRIEGDEGNDTLSGAAGDDSLDGGGGQDYLDGGAGDDFIEVSASDLVSGETLIGGADTDLLYMNFDTASTIDFMALSTSLSGFEELEFDSNANASPFLVARFSVAQAAAMAANLTLFQSDPTHTDFVVIVATGATTLDISGWQYGVWGTDDRVTFIDSSSADTFTGTSGADVVNGLAGGVDTFHGGDGDDWFMTTGALSGETYDGGGGNDTLVIGRVATAESDPEDRLFGFYISDYTLGTLTSIDIIDFGFPAPALPNQLTSDKAAVFLGSQIGAGVSSTANIRGVSGRSDVVQIDAIGGELDLSGFTFTTWTTRSGEFTIPGDDVVLVQGSAIADEITGTSVGDALFGDAGDDTLIGGAGEDNLDGGAGLDIVDAGAGNDDLDIYGSQWVAGENYDGGADWDTLYAHFDAGVAIGLYTGTISNIEAIVFEDEGQVVPALVLTLLDTYLASAPGNFSLTGSGGSALDLLFIVSSGGPNNIDLSGWQLNNFANDMVAYGGSAGNDTYVGSVALDSFRSGGGVDSASLGDNNDQLITQGNVAGASYNGGAGSDQIMIERSDATTTTIQGVSVYQSDLRTTTLTSFERMHFGNPGTLLTNQNSAKVAIVGAAQLGGGLSNALLITGVAGFTDALHVVMSSAGTVNLLGYTFATWNALVGTVEAGEDFVQVSGSTGVDSITGTTQGDVLLGLGGNDIIIGADGHDTIDGGAGADAMSGGGGDDTFVVDNVGDTATENSGQGTDLVRAFVTFTLGANVENLTLGGGASINGTGNGLDNVITGNIGDNQLFGLGGADILNGSFGADAMTGGAGDDTYYVDNAGDTAIESGGGGTDTVFSSISFTLGAQVENLTLTGGGANNATGNGLNNILVGNSGWNTLNGGFGADAMSGGLGNDTYVVDNVGDTVTEAFNEGIDTVNSTVSFTLGANVENLSFGGSADVDGTGNELNNKIIGNSGHNTILGGDGFDILFGNAGNDILDGGASQDQMYGGLGDDTYYVSQTNDTAFENAAGEGTDIVYSAAINYTISAGVENLTLLEAAGSGSKGIGNLLNNTLTGNSLNNVLFGKDGADVLDGGGGADTMYGGAGDDTFYVDHAGDIASENASEGNDIVFASVSYTLRANFEELTLVDSGGAINGFGNTLGNIITGNASANTLNGGAGDDTLNGGLGNDTLIGGAGDDTFVFVVGSGQDVVTGFVAGGVEDTLDLSAYDGTGVTWSITQVGADTLFTFSNGDTITLTNVNSANLVENDPFHYG